MRLRFRRLVSQHQHRLFTLAAHILGNRGEAEEIVQEAFIKLWNNMDRVDKRKTGAWLAQVTRNACLDLLRRRKHQVAFAMAAGAEHNQDMVPTPSDMLDSHLALGELGKAIHSLDEPYRSIVVLREMQDMSYQEIGEALELSLSQVKVYLHRARRKLREILTA